jgi:hypothetical protein
MHDEHYDPFRRPPPAVRPREVIVFMMVRARGDQTDSMRGSLRTAPQGVEALYTLNGELYRSAAVRVGGAGPRRPGDA